jgi:Domain of unknown function (DUF3859)
MRLPMLVISLLAAVPGAAAAQTATVTAPAATVSGVTVTNAGTYRAQSVSAPSGAGQLSPTGTVGTASNWHFVSKTSEVAGEVGTQFGIEFRLEGNPVGDGVTLHMVLKFPPKGIRNPNTGDTMHTTKIAFPNLKIGALCLLGYGFDKAWEIVPGVWTEQIWYQDRMLAEQTFTVSKPGRGDRFRGLRRHRSNNLSAALMYRLKALTPTAHPRKNTQTHRDQSSAF